MTMMMAAGMVFASMPVVRSGFAGGRSSVMAARLRSWVGCRFLALRGENCGRENQSKYCDDLFHYITPEKSGSFENVLNHTRDAKCRTSAAI
jgi:hypothetical protein